MVTGPPRIPGRRWIIGVLLGAGVLVNYIDRINLAVAAPQLQKEFNLSPEELGHCSAPSSGRTRCYRSLAASCSTGSP